MNRELRDLQTAAGATFSETVAAGNAPASFGNDRDALQAIQTGVALCDRTHWGCLQLSGDDRLRFLHNQSTNDFNSLQPGQGCDTVFVTSTARTIDLATAYVTDDAVLLIVSPNRRQSLMELLDRYIFPMDKVELKDISEAMAIFSLIGPQSHDRLAPFGVAAGQPHGTHQVVQIDGTDVRVATGSGLVTEGYTLVCDAANASGVWKTLTEAGAVPLGETVWEQVRVQQGRPASDRELSEDYNPLEAGLCHTISFNKGCYIGQETIARLNTYKGVKQHLRGIRLDAPVEPGTPVTVEDRKVGKLTSCVETPDGYVGLAYIRTKAGGAGLKVRVGDANGEVSDAPFLTRPAD